MRSAQETKVTTHRVSKVKTLISAEEIDNKVKMIAGRISADYAGRDIMLIGVLNGARVFMSDLAGAIDTPLIHDFITVSSYGAKMESSGEITIVEDVTIPVEDKDILIVEDIVETGLTLKFVKEFLYARKPASVKTCVLLDKPSGRKVDVKIDYYGFTAPDKFIVGYGLDYNGEYRDLPFIGFI